MYSSLPAEVILLVADQLYSPADLLNYIRTNRAHYNLLIRQLYRLNVRSDGGSALVWFASRGSERGVRGMLGAGANINVRGRSRSQSTALIEGITHKNTKMVRFLLKNGAIPDAVYSHHRRPLIQATRGSCDATIPQLLLEYGANVNQAERDQHPPLLEAVRSNQELKVALLLRHGAKIPAAGYHGMNLLHIAAAENATSGILDMLLGAEIPIDSQDGFGRTPLQVAAVHSSLRAVKELLKRKAKVNFKNMSERNQGWTALFYASGARNSTKPLKSIVKALIENGGDIDAIDNVRRTPLIYAISQAAITQAQELLNQGASVQSRTIHGETVLHFAASTPYWTPDTCMIRLLVNRGADVNWAGGPQGKTPLFYAIRAPDGLERVQTLLSLGAEVEFRNVNGQTPLSLAASMRSLKMTALLLEHGAAVDSPDLDGKYPLHHVVGTSFGRTQKAHEIIALLIAYGADVHCRDVGGYTPLHVIASKPWDWRPYWPEVGELLKAGADPHAKSNDGRTPPDMVPAGSQSEAQRVILQHYDPFRFNP